MLNNTLHEKNKYQVQGIFWDPMYQDFDIGDFTVNAYTKKQAEYKAKQHWMWQFAKKPPAIVKIQDELEQLIDDHINSDINR